MPNIMARLSRGARWLLSAEHLPKPPTDAFRSTARRPGLFHWLMTSAPLGDELPDTPEVPPGAAHARAGIVGWAVGQEELPGCERPETTGNRPGGLLRWVLSTEVCDGGVSLPGRSRRGVLSWLLATERL